MDRSESGREVTQRQILPGKVAQTKGRAPKSANGMESWIANLAKQAMDLSAPQLASKAQRQEKRAVKKQRRFEQQQQQQQQPQPQQNEVQVIPKRNISTLGTTSISKKRVRAIAKEILLASKRQQKQPKHKRNPISRIR